MHDIKRDYYFLTWFRFQSHLTSRGHYPRKCQSCMEIQYVGFVQMSMPVSGILWTCLQVYCINYERSKLYYIILWPHGLCYRPVGFSLHKRKWILDDGNCKKAIHLIDSAKIWSPKSRLWPVYHYERPKVVIKKRSCPTFKGSKFCHLFLKIKMSQRIP